MRPACADRGCQPEEKWYALTGRVVDAKVEADGDIHLALQDADGKNAGKNTHLTSSHVRVRVNSLGKLDRALIFLPVKSPEADPSFMRNV